MCSRDKEFTIKGTENCLARGFDRTGFFEVDTGEQRAWTVQLTESNEQQPAQRVPGIPGTVGPAAEPPGHIQCSGRSPACQSAGRNGSGRVWSAASRSARNQAMRRLRRIKILATLGPASSDSAMIRRLFEAGADVFRINMSHTPHDKMRELVKTIRNVESSYGRPIGILVDLQGPKLRLGSFAEGSIQLHNGESFVLDSDKTPGDNTRVQLPHPEILAALRPGHALLARRRQGAPDRRGNLARARRHPRRDRRQDVGPQGRQPARHRPAGVGDDAEGPRRSRSRAGDRHRLDRAVVRAARRGRHRGQEDDPRPRRRDVQDRKAAGDRPAAGNPRGIRRADGGARRSRRRTAAGAGAEPAEADDAAGAARRQAGGDRDPDAGIDDPERRCRPAPRSPTSPPRSTKAPTRSCCRRNRPPANIRSRRSRP